MDHNQQGSGQGRGGRRGGHFHRGRRNPDRRQGGQEPRAAQSPESQSTRTDQVDVEQIMRDIRARIAQRHGIDLSTAQIHELAARRLEAVLDPRNVNPDLLEQLRKAAGAKPVKDLVPSSVPPSFSFDDSTIYESHRGPLQAIRKLLNPILKLFFNPTPIAEALSTQSRINAELSSRESAREQQQAEWNALNYELVKRVVTESARLSLEVQALALRVESLSARVDFADRRVRTLEAAPQTGRHSGRSQQESHASALQSTPAPATVSDTATTVPQSGEAPGSPDGQRRRRRRRRGRRNGGPFGDSTAPQADGQALAGASADDGDDGVEDEVTDVAEAETHLVAQPQSVVTALQVVESAGPLVAREPEAPSATFEAPSNPDTPGEPESSS